ncbi:MAG: gliding motility-associated C-terminal domain-containing protein [Bacteroidales bacterium]|nr:gliding motility-associated C-terminal domain-containing protein [Bacteroidales bacterium]
MEVTFVNNSVYAIKYTWIFGDGDTVYLKDPQKDPEPHTYYQAGQTYTIKLIAESKERCIREDTITLKVDESELERPNVFSPNGDGMNDNFLIYNVSMREFHITIFSRSGRKVYEFQGPDINHWEGWDGKMGNSDASAGIYYYVLEAKSWDKPAINYKPKKTSGFVYLVRDK